MFFGCEANTVIILAESLEIQSYVFKPNSLVLNNWDENGPQFSRLANIIILENEAYFLVQPWETMYFNRHYHAYAVAECNEPTQIIRPSDLFTCRPFHATKCHNRQDQKWYVTTAFNIL